MQKVIRFTAFSHCDHDSQYLLSFQILQTSVASLRTSRTTEFERALFQLHTQLLGIAQQAIEPFDTSSGYNTNMTTSRSSVNQEFLNFLEVQARSQTRILEAEVRAGQELLRIHKSQHASELAALEHEATGLRLAKEETERLCAELRANLRSCRNELACHVASTTTIKR
ncbi:TPA: hypothetical protein N0F65_002336 [Lagenidium giganteum]|uniref:Uncharacterized protein n=1 Tax=Lagenidium giganteum TaxID=4803 RepID=A0AAV2Z4I8_9STRA|nr:TPA: hypothetical protein N0F65_002336 [Lagenidium giganteum]